MKKAFYLFILLLIGSNIYAGEASDNLAKCLVDSTSNKDKIVLVRWVFAIISAHPDVKEDFSVSDEKKDGFDKDVARVYERLLAEDCVEQAKAVIKTEGTQAFEKSFEVLGAVAMDGLMSDSQVSEASYSFVKYLDKDKLSTLGD